MSRYGVQALFETFRSLFENYTSGIEIDRMPWWLRVLTKRTIEMSIKYYVSGIALAGVLAMASAPAVAQG